MQGSWNNHAAYYRCMFLSRYAAKNKVDHPRAVYLREDQLMPSLDHSLAQVLHPDALPHTVRQMEEAQDVGATDAGAEKARRDIADCDAKLRQHRAALEAGADPVLVTSWMAETQAQRAVAETRLSPPPSRPKRMTRDQIISLVSGIRDLITVLASADPADKANVYGQLGS
jgi:site-specific DNA recombinase